MKESAVPVRSGPVIVELDRTLDEIAPPEPCGFCGGMQQREYLEYYNTIDGIDVAATGIPGYGCTKCHAKEWIPSEIEQMMRGISREAGRNGYESLSEYALGRAETYSRNRP